METNVHVNSVSGSGEEPYRVRRRRWRVK
jgi:hypothetical protein